MTPFTQGPLQRSIFFGTFTSVSELTGFIKSCVSLCQEGRKEHVISQGFFFFFPFSLHHSPFSFYFISCCGSFLLKVFIISFLSRFFMQQPVLTLQVHTPRNSILHVHIVLEIIPWHRLKEDSMGHHLTSWMIGFFLLSPTSFFLSL